MHCRKPPQVPSPSAPWIENIQDPGGELQHLLPSRNVLRSSEVKKIPRNNYRSCKKRTQNFRLLDYRSIDGAFQCFSIHFLCSPLFQGKITILTKIFQLGASTSRDALFSLTWKTPRFYKPPCRVPFVILPACYVLVLLGGWDQCGFWHP